MASLTTLSPVAAPVMRVIGEKSAVCFVTSVPDLQVVGRMSSDTTASQMEDLESLLEVTVVGAKVPSHALSAGVTSLTRLQSSQDLKNRDAIGKNDPFAVVTFGLTTFKTATICGT